MHKPVGQRVGKIFHAGAELLDEQEVEVVLNQYRGIGGGDYPMFNVDKIVREYADDMPKLIIQYLQDHPKITAAQPHNIHLLRG
mgnify:FL=1